MTGRGAAASDGRLRKILEALPADCGSVRRILPSAGPAGPVVIHVQDVHRNQEAQRNIGRAARALARGGGAGLVALEGAFAPIDVSGARAFPDKAVLRHTADYLLRENGVSGPVHAALTDDQGLPPLVGVDDPAHYAANVEAYRRAAPRAETLRSGLAVRRRALERRKAETFGPALKDFDGKVEGFRSGSLTLGDYAEALAAAEPFRPGSSAADFIEALRLEKSLDFKRVEAERVGLIEALARRLDGRELRGILDLGAAYRLGRLRAGDFYRRLRGLCEARGTALSAFPAMEAYVRYALAADRVNAERLWPELRSAERDAYVRLARSPEERALVAASRRSYLAGKLVDFSLSPEEWGEYKSFGGEGRDFVPFESFYEEARARDAAMAANLLARMKEGRAGVAVLVTGGFHSRGMDAALQARGAAVVSFTPLMTKADASDGAALTVFARENAPLESLFRGEKLFLADHPDRDLSLFPVLASAAEAVKSGARKVGRTLAGGFNLIVRTSGRSFAGKLSSPGGAAVSFRGAYDPKDGFVGTVSQERAVALAAAAILASVAGLSVAVKLLPAGLQPVLMATGGGLYFLLRSLSSIALPLSAAALGLALWASLDVGRRLREALEAFRRSIGLEPAFAGGPGVWNIGPSDSDEKGRGGLMREAGEEFSPVVAGGAAEPSPELRTWLDFLRDLNDRADGLRKRTLGLQNMNAVATEKRLYSSFLSVFLFFEEQGSRLQYFPGGVGQVELTAPDDETIARVLEALGPEWEKRRLGDFQSDAGRILVSDSGRAELLWSRSAVLARLDRPRMLFHAVRSLTDHLAGFSLDAHQLEVYGGRVNYIDADRLVQLIPLLARHLWGFAPSGETTDPRRRGWDVDVVREALRPELYDIPNFASKRQLFIDLEPAGERAAAAEKIDGMAKAGEYQHLRRIWKGLEAELGPEGMARMRAELPETATPPDGGTPGAGAAGFFVPALFFGAGALDYLHPMASGAVTASMTSVLLPVLAVSALGWVGHWTYGWIRRRSMEKRLRRNAISISVARKVIEIEDELRARPPGDPPGPGRTMNGILFLLGIGSASLGFSMPAQAAGRQMRAAPVLAAPSAPLNPLFDDFQRRREEGQYATRVPRMKAGLADLAEENRARANEAYYALAAHLRRWREEKGGPLAPEPPFDGPRDYAKSLPGADLDAALALFLHLVDRDDVRPQAGLEETPAYARGLQTLRGMSAERTSGSSAFVDRVEAARVKNTANLLASDLFDDEDRVFIKGVMAEHVGAHALIAEPDGWPARVSTAGLIRVFLEDFMPHEVRDAARRRVRSLGRPEARTKARDAWGKFQRVLESQRYGAGDDDEPLDVPAEPPSEPSAETATSRALASAGKVSGRFYSLAGFFASVPLVKGLIEDLASTGSSWIAGAAAAALALPLLMAAAAGLRLYLSGIQARLRGAPDIPPAAMDLARRLSAAASVRAGGPSSPGRRGAAVLALKKVLDGDPSLGVGRLVADAPAVSDDDLARAASRLRRGARRSRSPALAAASVFLAFLSGGIVRPAMAEEAVQVSPDEIVEVVMNVADRTNEAVKYGGEGGPAATEGSLGTAVAELAAPAESSESTPEEDPEDEYPPIAGDDNKFIDQLRNLRFVGDSTRLDSQDLIELSGDPDLKSKILGLAQREEYAFLFIIDKFTPQVAEASVPAMEWVMDNHADLFEKNVAKAVKLKEYAADPDYGYADKDHPSRAWYLAQILVHSRHPKAGAVLARLGYPRAEAAPATGENPDAASAVIELSAKLDSLKRGGGAVQPPTGAGGDAAEGSGLRHRTAPVRKMILKAMLVVIAGLVAAMIAIFAWARRRSSKGKTMSALLFLAGAHLLWQGTSRAAGRAAVEAAQTSASWAPGWGFVLAAGILVAAVSAALVRRRAKSEAPFRSLSRREAFAGLSRAWVNARAGSAGGRASGLDRSEPEIFVVTGENARGVPALAASHAAGGAPLMLVAAEPGLARDAVLAAASSPGVVPLEAPGLFSMDRGRPPVLPVRSLFELLKGDPRVSAWAGKILRKEVRFRLGIPAGVDLDWEGDVDGVSVSDFREWARLVLMAADAAAPISLREFDRLSRRALLISRQA